MAVDLLDVDVDAVGDGVGHEVREVSAVLVGDAGHRVVLGVDEGVVGADARQEVLDALGQGTRAVLGEEDGDVGVAVDDLEHAVEELGRRDGLGADPVLLLPVAHGVGVGGAALDAAAHEVVDGVVMVLLGEFAREGIGGLAHLDEVDGEVGIHLRIVVVVLRELAGVLHEAVGDHEELELLVLGIGDAVGDGLGERGIGVVDEADGGAADLVEDLHGLDDLDGVTGDGAQHDDGVLGDALVAAGVVLGGVDGIHGKVGQLDRMRLGLEGRCPGAADADVDDTVIALGADLVDDLLDLGAQGQGAVDAVDLLLLIELQHGVPLSRL